MENIHLIFNKVYIIYSKSLLFLLFVVHSFLLSSQIQSVFFFFSQHVLRVLNVHKRQLMTQLAIVIRKGNFRLAILHNNISI
jgi:hypothetical protein